MCTKVAVKHQSSSANPHTHACMCAYILLIRVRVLSFIYLIVLSYSQAIECQLADVAPLNEDIGWPAEVRTELLTLTGFIVLFWV